ncbi:hypothetical protein KKA24_03015, partial [Patescibacteria group bacterium]|nr:hypothetical protein [Patescibacteria group bacterium]
MITKNKKHILLLGTIVISLMTPFMALANPFTTLARLVANIPGDIVGAIIGFLILISMAFTSLTGGILDFVISPGFVEWGYTQNNPIIAIGLGITKQFVNMGLVAILITISFLVTLRIKEYDAKKLLVNLIIIALLVNFAPVLVGLIVDASNITMSYFLGGISKGVSGVFGQGGGSALTQDIKTLTMGTWAQQSNILLKKPSMDYEPQSSSQFLQINQN